MNYRIVLKSLGVLLICEAVSMLFALIVSLIYKESISAFLYSIGITLFAGLVMFKIKPLSQSIYARDGFVIVGLGWVMVSFFGCLPFYISGTIPVLINSFFESVSGFTTTGASILIEIESLPKGILFWRSFTHWVGGMGVLMLALAILPSVGARTLHIMRAESPGPNPGKLVPRISQTAKILYSIYFSITVIEIILLFIAGLPLYDSFIHAFGTAGTGGFSNRNLSVGAYGNIYVEIIITVFMLIFGANFALYFQILKGNSKSILKNEEFRFYLGVVFFSIAIVTINLTGLFDSIGQSLRYSSFQVASILTTTGYTTADFNQWPILSKMLLLLLMFVGGCAGSTGGAMKNIRILMLFKIIKTEIMKLVHPKAVHPVKIDGKAVDGGTVNGVKVFFITYIFIFVASILIISLDGKDIATTISSVAATIGNIGPGLGEVGATGNYFHMSVLSKLVLSFCMIVGRLEVFPILLLFVPAFWKKVNI